MARPSPVDIETETNLMLAHGRLSEALDLLGKASAIGRQVFNRFPLAKGFIDHLQNVLTDAVDQIDATQMQIKQQIDLEQSRRTCKNGKAKKVRDESQS